MVACAVACFQPYFRRMRNLISLLSLILICTFSGLGQICDSVHVTMVEHSITADSVIIVKIENSSSEFFSYPGVVLYDANGDTVAKETPNLFGIGSQSIHWLNIKSTSPPTSISSGRIELWTNFYDSLNCTFQLDTSTSLCPDDSCYTLHPFAGGFGGAYSIGTFSYKVYTVLGVLKAQGTLTLNDTVQYAKDTICLPKDQYIWHFEVDTPPGGGPYMGFEDRYQNSFSLSVPMYILDTTMQTVLFPNCYSLNSLAELGNSSINVFQTPAEVFIRSEVELISSVSLIDLTGKVIRHDWPNEKSYTLETKLLSSGIYLLSIETEKLKYYKKLFKP